MSGAVPTAPTVPEDQMESQVPILDSKPDAPPAYSPHFVPGPPGSAMPQPGTGLPMVYYNAQQPSTFPLHQPGGTSPIQYQPGRYPAPRQTAPITWMTGPTPMPNCPPGLEFLTQLDNVHVLQHFQPIEMMINFEANNKYDVRNNENQMIYVVTEDTDDYSRNAYHGLRPFVLRVTDSLNREVMTMQRPLKCTICCYCCCPSTRQEMEIQCPPGVTIGFVREHWNLFRAIYNLQNEKKEVMMKIVGPCLSSGCCSDFVFQVKSLEGTSIGSITRKWNGLVAAAADAEHFEICFPLNLDVKMKAMIFGACFLIDFVHFERSAQSRHQSHGHHGHRH